MTATVTPIHRQPPSPPRPPTGGDWKARLVTEQTRRGDSKIVNCNANATTILRAHPAWRDVLAWDELSQAIVCRNAAPWEPDDAPPSNEPGRPWEESDGTRVANWLIRREGLNVSEETAYRAALLVARSRPFDPLRERIMSLTWDGKRRVDRVLHTYFGAADDAYTRFVGPAFLVGSIARALRPGCKMDYMLILEGPQGLFKSQGARRLYWPEWFRESPVDLRSNDRFIALRGCWCREWPELDGLGKADAARVKSFLSPEWDDFRMPYGRGMLHVPRRNVFIATVNPPQLGYLVDESGNRRMWPVVCGVTGPIQLDAIEADRAQIWAEAREMFEGGRKWWPSTPAEHALCNGQQEARMQAEAWEGQIGDWLDAPMRQKPGATVTVREILRDVLQVPAHLWDNRNSHRVGVVLGRCGWVVVGQRRGGEGKRERYYMKLADAAQPDANEGERAAMAST